MYPSTLVQKLEPSTSIEALFQRRNAIWLVMIVQLLPNDIYQVADIRLLTLLL